jgi:hypothetical protein
MVVERGQLLAGTHETALAEPENGRGLKIQGGNRQPREELRMSASGRAGK